MNYEMDDDNIVVSICCITYNQIKYIRNALDSFLMQELQGSFEIIVHDDASTDGTAEVIKEYIDKYPGIVKGILQKQNQFAKGNRRILLNELVPRAKGKYIAVCEGDDFWTDKFKLYKQLNSLKKDSYCVASTHRVQIVQEDGKLIGRTIPSFIIESGIIKSDDYIKMVFNEDRHLFHTSSVLFRRETASKIIGSLPEFMKNTEAGDRALFLYLATQGDIVYINEDMSCYRIMSEGSWSQQMSSSQKKTYEHNVVMIEMAEKFNLYTNQKYEKEIYKYISLYKFNVSMYMLDGKELKKERYEKLYAKLTYKQKFYFTLCSYFPVIGKIYRKIKKFQ